MFCHENHKKQNTIKTKLILFNIIQNQLTTDECGEIHNMFTK